MQYVSTAKLFEKQQLTTNSHLPTGALNADSPAKWQVNRIVS
ncbi:MAG: hypothetical protein ACP5FK_06380 [bacterium]